MPVDVDRIRTVPLFADLSDQELKAVADKLERRDAHVGEHLSSEGGAGYFFFVLESGGAIVTRGDEQLATLERLRVRAVHDPARSSSTACEGARSRTCRITTAPARAGKPAARRPSSQSPASSPSPPTSGSASPSNSPLRIISTRQ